MLNNHKNLINIHAITEVVQLAAFMWYEHNYWDIYSKIDALSGYCRLLNKWNKSSFPT